MIPYALPLVLAALLLPVSETLVAQSPDTAARIVSGALGTRADSVLSVLTTRGFSGVALAARDGQIILRKGYGLADRAAKAPMTPESVVQIGSNTKDFTIVAILQLVERGKLSLSDGIGRFLKGVPNDKTRITIEHLLHHRAGFDQHMGDDFEPVTRDQEIARAMAANLLFEPGSDRKYSNIGYSLLAAVIEIVSGVSYDQYVQRNIFDPLSLKQTGLLLPQFDKRRLARGYRNGRDMGTFLERPLAPDGPYWNLRGNGGMLSTVGDMHRFYQWLMSDNPQPILSAASRDLYFHPDRPAVLAGSDMTWFFFYSRFPGAKLDFILASNSTDYPAPRAREEVAAALGVVAPGGPAGGGGRQISVSLDTGGSAITLPDEPAGRAAQKLLQVHNEGDAAAVRRFLQQDVVPRAGDTRSIDERAAGFKAMQDDLGTLTPIRLVSSTPRGIVFRARSARQGTATFTVNVEADPPHRITGIRVEAP